MSTKILIAGFFGIIVLLLVGGRFFDGNNGTTPGGRQLARPAPSTELTSLNGGTISLADYQGKKPVILDFFATWCPNCRRDMPKLSKFYEKYKDDVEVIGVNLRENPDIVREFISSRNITFPIVLDPSGRVARDYQVQYTNTHVLINKEGNIVRIIPGDIRESDITLLIQEG